MSRLEELIQLWQEKGPWLRADQRDGARKLRANLYRFPCLRCVEAERRELRGLSHGLAVYDVTIENGLSTWQKLCSHELRLHRKQEFPKEKSTWPTGRIPDALGLATDLVYCNWATDVDHQQSIIDHQYQH